MGPIFHELKKTYEKKPVRFVLLDLTNKETAEKARALGLELGIENIFALNSYTAVIMLLDANNLNVVNQLDLRYTIDEMRQRIDQALKI